MNNKRLKEIIADKEDIIYSEGKGKYIVVTSSSGIEYYKRTDKAWYDYKEIEKDEMPGDIENKMIKESL